MYDLFYLKESILLEEYKLLLKLKSKFIKYNFIPMFKNLMLPQLNLLKSKYASRKHPFLKFKHFYKKSGFKIYSFEIIQ